MNCLVCTLMNFCMFRTITQELERAGMAKKHGRKATLTPNWVIAPLTLL